MNSAIKEEDRRKREIRMLSKLFSPPDGFSRKRLRMRAFEAARTKAPAPNYKKRKKEKLSRQPCKTKSSCHPGKGAHCVQVVSSSCMYLFWEGGGMATIRSKSPTMGEKGTTLEHLLQFVNAVVVGQQFLRNPNSLKIGHLNLTRTELPFQFVKPQNPQGKGVNYSNRYTGHFCI